MDAGRRSPSIMRGFTARVPGCCSAARSRSPISAAGSARIFTKREAVYLFENEWALTAADILERRTKHGLHMSRGRAHVLRRLVLRPIGEGGLMGRIASAEITTEFAALRRLSARIGADPMLVQGAGGNTSIKQDEHALDQGVRHLADARGSATTSWSRWRSSRCSTPSSADDPEAEKAQEFVIAELNPAGLRPSIETTVHALMPQRVVRACPLRRDHRLRGADRAPKLFSKSGCAGLELGLRALPRGQACRWRKPSRSGCGPRPTC